MALLDEIRRKIEADEFEFSRHAVDQTITRRISVREVREVFANAEVIEDHPDDKYGPQLLDLWQDGGREAPTYPVQLSVPATDQGHYA